MPELSRRSLIKAASMASGGFILNFQLPACKQKNFKGLFKEENITFAPNAWLAITRDDRCIFTLDKVEMGQGVMTSLAAIIAEELDIHPQKLEIKFADANPIYKNPIQRSQITGGSSSVRDSYTQLRDAGATARSMILQAATKKWGVLPKHCYTENGRVYQKNSALSLSYGELASLAALEKLDAKPSWKKAKDFRWLGKPLIRLDLEDKIRGKATYGIDANLANKLYATLIKPPYLGAKALKIKNERELFKNQSFHSAHILSDGHACVVASRFYETQEISQIAKISWQKPAEMFDSSHIDQSYQDKLNEGKGDRVHSTQDPDKFFADSSEDLRAEYNLPFQAHATLEPQNCLIWVQKDNCEAWVPTQSPGPCHEVICELTGLDHEKVSVHVTHLGGGFGRRLEMDFVKQATEISMKTMKPIHLIWNRETDTAHDFYRPKTKHLLKASLNSDKKIVAWYHQLVGPSILAQRVADPLKNTLPQWVPFSIKRGAASLATSLLSGLVTDPTTVEGMELPYKIDHIDLRASYFDPGVPIGFWRSVGNSHNGFAVESFFDETAHLMHKDPYYARLELLKENPKATQVLKTAAKLANYQMRPDNKSAMGVAYHYSFKSHVAQICLLEAAGARLRLKKVFCAIDCGMAINPDGIKAQIEGAVMFALTAAVKSKITLKDGQVEQSNFHNFEILRHNEAPQIEVAVIESDSPPMGVGEPGVPPLAAALANGYFILTGKRVRELPFELKLQ